MKKISTLLGVIIIVIAAVVLFGVVFTYEKYFTPKLKIVPAIQQKTKLQNVPCKRYADCGPKQTCAKGICIDMAICKPDWVCSWGPCVNGSQQQSGHDLNTCDGGYGGSPIEEQTPGCSPLVRVCSPSIPPTLEVILPISGVWRLGSVQKINYVPGKNTPIAGTCIDSFLVNSEGKEVPLTDGEYIHGDSSNNIISFELNANKVNPGQYRVEVKVRGCSEGFFPYSEWGISDDYVTVTQ